MISITVDFVSLSCQMHIWCIGNILRRIYHIHEYFFKRFWYQINYALSKIQARVRTREQRVYLSVSVISALRSPHSKKRKFNLGIRNPKVANIPNFQPRGHDLQSMLMWQPRREMTRPGILKYFVCIKCGCVSSFCLFVCVWAVNDWIPRMWMTKWVITVRQDYIDRWENEWFTLPYNATLE